MDTHSPSWFESRRPLKPPVGTAAELLADAHQVANVDPPFRDLLNQPETLLRISDDKVPIPATQDREGYNGDRHLAYWLSGLQDMHLIETLVPSASLEHVLDLGGATGRVARQVVHVDPKALVTIAELADRPLPPLAVSHRHDSELVPLPLPEYRRSIGRLTAPFTNPLSRLMSAWRRVKRR